MGRLLLLLALPVAAQAQWQYTVSYDLKITITGYTGSGGAVTIPSRLEDGWLGYLPVIAIGDNAFRSCTTVTSVGIPASVIGLGTNVFSGCTHLTSVTIGGPVRSIPDRMFFDCFALTNVTIPPSATSIGDYAFFYCTNLTSVIIPSSVTSIGDLAFYNCTSLASVTIGTSVTSIGDDAFFYCTTLTTVIIPSSVTSIGEGAFYGCTKLTSVAIGNSVTDIGDMAFESCTSLTSASIPNSVTSIGDAAFFDCTRLTNVTIPGSVTSIGDSAFGSCYGLTSVTIPSSVTSIGDYAFVFCTRLTAITVGALNPVYSSAGGVLFNKGQTTLITYPAGKAGSYTIPNNVVSIGKSAFEGSYGLASVTIPNSVTSLGSNAFAFTGLGGVFFQGNAPTPNADSTVFSNDSNPIVYYLPGTTGWASMFDGCRTVPLIPTLVVTAPTAGLRVSNANYTITGTATDPVAVTEVFYALNNSGWTPATTSNHWAKWTAPVSLIPGTNTIAAYAVDTLGQSSPTKSVSLEYVVPARLTVRTNGNGTISPNYNGAWLAIGESYTMTATAAPGYGFTGWTGSRSTNGATLTFVMASNLTFTANFVVVTIPTLTITAPKSGQLCSNAACCATGTAKDKVQVSSVWCEWNNGGWAMATGTTNWTNDATLTPGTNIVRAYAVNSFGYPSLTNSVSFFYVVTNQLVVTATGPCTLSPNYSNAWLEIGRSYSMTVTPGKGYVFSNWVGTVPSDKMGSRFLPIPGNRVILCSTPQLTFLMQAGLVLQANIIPNPFIRKKGTYNGLFGPYFGTGRAQESSGFFTLTVTDQGGYSGSLKQGLNSYSLSGQLGVDGNATAQVLRPGTNAWVVAMDLGGYSELTGTVSNGVVNGWVTSLWADRVAFSRTNPAPCAGTYTLAIPGLNHADGTTALGDGYGTLTVDANGGVSLSGSLADGTALNLVSGQNPLVSGGLLSGFQYWPLYVPLYSGKGSVWGYVEFYEGYPGVEGQLSWIKPANPANTYYPGGFTNECEIAVAPYSATNKPVLALTNGVLVFSGGNLAVPLADEVLLTNASRFVNLSTNPMALTVNVANGYLSGWFKVPGAGKTNQFNGVLLQELNAGYGYFLGANQSGSVQITPPAPPSGMALIPAGSFTMGDTLDGESDAIPTVTANVSAFYMDVNLVSYSQWQGVYNWATNHGYGFVHAGAGKAANHPVQMVDWYDCVKWCNARSQQAGKTLAYYTDAGMTQVYTNGEVTPYVNWSAKGYRLPTEAEWEKAARGGLRGQRFPWGDTISESQANYYGDTADYSYDLGPNGYNAPFDTGEFPYTSPVGSFAPNGYGLYDMAGNVWEPCWDWYGTPYAGGTDPRGPASGSYRVARGGDWGLNAAYCRTANRNTLYPTYSYNIALRSVLPSGQ